MAKPKKKKKNTKTTAKTWTGAEVSKLSILADQQNATAKGSGLNMVRTTGSASNAKSSRKNVSLNPTKQSSYSRRKK